MLEGRGIDATSVEGGIDSWNGLVSRAQLDQGMYLIEGNETPEQAVALAYGLEEGARRFYRDLSERVDDVETQDLFRTLSEAEVRHEDWLWERYRALPGSLPDRGAFEKSVVPKALEGGITAEEVLARYPADLRSPFETLDLAMALETDALDLYLRMAQATENPGTKGVFLDLAAEEKRHLKRLGDLLGRQTRADAA